MRETTLTPAEPREPVHQAHRQGAARVADALRPARGGARTCGGGCAIRRRWLLWIGIPLVIGGLMSLVVGGGGRRAPRRACSSSTRTTASRQRPACRRARAGQAREMLRRRGRRRSTTAARGSSDGEPSALLVDSRRAFRTRVLERGAGDARARRRTPPQRILPGIVRGDARDRSSTAAFYAQRLVRRAAARRSPARRPPGARPADDDVARDQPSRSTSACARCRATLLPPVDRARRSKTRRPPTAAAARASARCSSRACCSCRCSSSRRA